MGIKILLADDSVTAQNMGKKILSEAGHEVVTVSNGSAAAKKIAEIKPELVLLDVFMPGYSGLELCEKLRSSAETAKLPVLLTVGRMEPYSPQDGARVRADGVIVKPFEASDLTAAVERFAQKAKPAKQAPAEYERTMRIAPPSGSRDDTSRDSQKIAAFGGGDPRVYEQTVRLDAAQIAAMLNSAASKAEKPAPESAPQPDISVASAPEFPVAPAAPLADVSTADERGPVFGKEFLPEVHANEPQPAAIPSYMAQYLTDQSARAVESTAAEPQAAAPSPDFDPEKTVVMWPSEKAPSSVVEFPAVREELTPTAPISDDLLSHRFPGDLSPAPVASAEGLELTAAAPVADVPIAQESQLETILQTPETPTIVFQDPALVTDPYRATMDFPTRFASTESTKSEGAEVQSPEEEVTASVDEFEARLKAAMSSYDAPSTDLPLPSPAQAPSGDLHSGLVRQFPVPGEDLPGFEAPDEPLFATAPIGSSELALPEPAQEMEVAPEPPSNLVEFHPASFEVPESTADKRPQLETVAEESEPEVAADVVEISTVSTHAAFTPETDEAVIQQMRESFSSQSVDRSHFTESAEIQPMGLAAAATAAAPAAATPPEVGHEAESEIARALAAAVGEKGAAEQASFTDRDATGAATTEDANRLAAAVEKVMQRELPNLIWKIMAELDLGKR